VRAVGVIVIVALVGFAVLAGFGVQRLVASAQFESERQAVALETHHPSAQRLYVDPAAQVVTAAATDPRFAELAAIPQGKWFTGWTSVASIENDIATYVDAADVAGEVPLVVLYQIPGRDCGGFASGGLTTKAQYEAWIDGAAAALTGHDAIVVIEPDALPQLGACDEQGDRIGMLRNASKTLGATGARVYIDAGHSNWKSPAEMAKRLVDAGIEYTRGFSTNVSNFYDTTAETVFAEKVETELAALGEEDAHYIIDTGRNGAGSDGEVCNPTSARIGTEPVLFDSGDLDGYLWIKNVGESDGTCHGGPSSGFDADLALRLLGP